MAFLDFLTKPVGGYTGGVTNPAAGGTSPRNPRTDMSWGSLLGNLMATSPQDRALGNYMTQRYALPSITGTDNRGKDTQDLSDVVELMKLFGMG